jgi:D-alanyl-D-alanine carboxypeptidase
VATYSNKRTEFAAKAALDVRESLTAFPRRVAAPIRVHHTRLCYRCRTSNLNSSARERTGYSCSMNHRLSPRSRLAACLALLAALAGFTVPVCLAAPSPLLGSVVIDVNSGAVLHAQNANRRVRPASLTKLMTALLVMQHLADSQHNAQRKWPVSTRAAAQPASRLGLRAGHEIEADMVLNAVLIPSANDAAMVAAEAVAGDETSFVRRMNETAARLGMTRTHFANPSGLPAQQFTTARDIAVLARHLWQAFPAQRKRYTQTGFTYAGRWVSTTNPLLGSYRGARGMKTGFTCRAGFHLTGIVERKGRVLVAVVLGARARDTRSRHIHELFNKAFAKRAGDSTMNVAQLASAQGQGDRLPASTSIIADPCLIAKGPTGWNIDVGIHRSKKGARKLARDFIKARRTSLRGARSMSIPRHIGVDLHRAIVTGLDQVRARRACLDFRKQGGSCIIFGATVADAQLEEAARVRALSSAFRAAQAKRSK